MSVPPRPTAAGSALPGTVRRVFERRNLIGCGMNVGDAYGSLFGTQQQLIACRIPVFLPGDWVRGNLSQVTGAHQFIERHGRGLFVQCVLIDCVPHDEEILVESCLVRANDGLFVPPGADRCQNRNDRYHDHQFKKRKAANQEESSAPVNLRGFAYSHLICRSVQNTNYQSEYFVPSRPIPEDLL